MPNKCLIAALIVLSLCSFAQARTAGLIVEDPAALESYGFDAQMKTRLESLGYNVELISGDDVKGEVFTIADAEAMDVIVVSESISSSDATPLIGADVPMMNAEGFGWKKMYYAEDGTQGWQFANSLADVVNDTHPIVVDANLSVGTVEFLLDPNADTTTTQVSMLAPGAVSLVSMAIDGNDYALVYAIDKGAELAQGQGAAVNRIVGFSLPGSVNGDNVVDYLLSDEGWALFDAAIGWLDPAPHAGLIVEDPAALESYGFDAQMKTRLESLGYLVELISGDDVKGEVFTIADAEAMDVIVVSESISSSDATPLIGADVPMMNAEGFGWKKMYYAEDGTQGWQFANSLADVVNDTHPIVADANLSVGTVEFLLDPNADTTTTQVSMLASGAVSLVSMAIDGNDYALVYAIDKGAELAQGQGLAVNRIVGFSLPGSVNGDNVVDYILSDYGWALFDAAIGWLDPEFPVADGLVMYLDAGKIEGIADGNSVSVWEDLSDAGNDANQPSVDNQPVYVAASEAFAGQPAVRFNGESSWMPLNSTMVNVGSFTLIAVANFSQLETSQYIVAGQDGSGNDRLRIQADAAIDGTPFLWRVGNSSWKGITATSDTDIHAFGVTSTVEGFVDGVSVGTASNSSTENPTAFNIGSYNRGQKDFFDGDLAILVLYDRVLSEEEIAEMTTYLTVQALSGE